MKFSIGIVYYSGIGDLEMAISSLLAQTYSDFEILIRDHSDNNEAFDFIKKNFNTCENGKISIFTGDNIFHSAGHNFLISEMQGENYICASVDMKYKKTMLEKLCKTMSLQNNYDCFTGKLLNNENTIDSTGIEKTWYFRFYDRGQGSAPSSYSLSGHVFGASGAFFCMRKSLITKLSFGCFQEGREQVFNEQIYYKNDVDIACRIFLLNCKCWYDSSVYAVHNRTTSVSSHKSLFALSSSIKGQKILLQLYSSRLLSWWQRPFAWGAYFFSWIRKFI